MSTSYIVLDDDDDNHSLSPSKNSDNDDDDVDSCTSAHTHAHRSCSRYASCNKTKHTFLSPDSAFASRSTTSGGPRRGDLRTVINEPGHQQKYDGTKWRRICCIPNCLRCLNRGVYFQNWLCRKHYRLTITIDLSSDSNSSVIIDENPRPPRRKTLSKPSTRSSSKKKVGLPRRGDIMMQADGTRQKYDGQSWRLACKDIHCKCLAIAHGYCRRHDILTRKKNLNCNSISTDLVLSIVDPTVISIPVSKSSITRSRSSKAAKLKRGDIQLVRQQWNGTKWYSLCHHPSGNCKNRSGGAKCAHLCQVHYRERQEKQQKPNLFNGNEHLSLLERTIRPIGNLGMNQTSGITEKPRLESQTESDISQAVQTDLTYSLDTTDLRQACVFIDDDTLDASQTTASTDANQIKKETEACRNQASISYSSSTSQLVFPFDCKVEIRKLELP